jgi:hypothetical protein
MSIEVAYELQILMLMATSCVLFCGRDLRDDWVDAKPFQNVVIKIGGNFCVSRRPSTFGPGSWSRVSRHSRPVQNSKDTLSSAVFFVVWGANLKKGKRKRGEEKRRKEEKKGKKREGKEKKV